VHQDQLILLLFKTEYSKIITVLCKLFGTVNIQVAEDITNDTFLLATETWEMKGVPKNPAAWLYTVAKNNTKDYLKRNTTFSNKVIPSLKRIQNESEEWSLDMSDKNIKDSQLEMIFAICHPVIPASSQIGLALKILCGFSIDEIADAFLTNKENINKRLFRAKEKLREINISIDLLKSSEINERIDSVLKTMYLLFNEGYYSTSQNVVLRKELCLEAMRLNYVLIESEVTNRADVYALMSLMCFHSSRFNARINELGEAILYDDQDKRQWDDSLIDKGNYFLIKSAVGDTVSKYHIEASIAYWHSSKLYHHDKWRNILQLYNQLLQLEYSQIAALNRTFALSKVYGKEKAIGEALKLDLKNNHFYYALLGSLYTGCHKKNAILAYEKALVLAKTKQDKITIRNYLKKLEC
jgi:RNA polymerase sigma factor (sigma-70 family)